MSAPLNTWGEFEAATPEQQRACMREILAEWSNADACGYALDSLKDDEFDEAGDFRVAIVEPGT